MQGGAGYALFGSISTADVSRLSESNKQLREIKEVFNVNQMMTDRFHLQVDRAAEGKLFPCMCLRERDDAESISPQQGVMSKVLPTCACFPSFPQI
jgi:hypothetical protein